MERPATAEVTDWLSHAGSKQRPDRPPELAGDYKGEYMFLHDFIQLGAICKLFFFSCKSPFKDQLFFYFYIVALQKPQL